MLRSAFLRRPLALLAGMAFTFLLGACEPDSQPAERSEPLSAHLDSLEQVSVTSAAETATRRVQSQTLYAPVYSHILVRDAQNRKALTTTLSIRNTSSSSPIAISTVDYYDETGNRVRSHVDTGRELPPMGSTHVVVERTDLTGGVGANFIVRWQADEPVSPPVVETVMIASQQTQGISFLSPARVLSESPGEEVEAGTSP